MQIVCTSLQSDNHASTSSLNFLQAGCSFWCPTDSVRVLRAVPMINIIVVYYYEWSNFYHHFPFCQVNLNWPVAPLAVFLHLFQKRTCPDSWHRYFCMLDVLPVAKPTVSKNWMKLEASTPTSRNHSVIYHWGSPAHVVQWSNHLGAMCNRAWCSQWPRIERPRRVRLLKKNYFK